MNWLALAAKAFDIFGSIFSSLKLGAAWLAGWVSARNTFEVDHEKIINGVLKDDVDVEAKKAAIDAEPDADINDILGRMRRPAGDPDAGL